MNSEVSTEFPAEEPATSSFVGVPIRDGIRELVLIFGWLACVSGIVGNVLIIVTLLTQPALRSAHNLYIANMAIADLVVEGYYMPFWLLDLILGYHPVLNEQHCVTNAFLSIVCLHSSIFTLVLISFNRYLCIGCATVNKCRLFNKSTIIVSCVVVWFVSAIAGLLPVFHVDGSFYTYSSRAHLCTFDGIRNPMNVFVFLSVMNVVVPTILVTILNLAIVRFWKKSRSRINQWTQNQLDMNRRQPSLSVADMALIRSLVLVFVILIVLYMPLATAVAIMGKVHVSPNVLCTFVLLFFVNSSINWIVYGALNKNFRKGYRQLVVGGCRWSTSVSLQLWRNPSEAQ